MNQFHKKRPIRLNKNVDEDNIIPTYEVGDGDDDDDDGDNDDDDDDDDKITMIDPMTTIMAPRRRPNDEGVEIPEGFFQYTRLVKVSLQINMMVE
ncbi:CMF_HP2_G0012220.mRNA.1.CDS.1 [Saccharomyces cerevisiae]|nr:CMF_HP2_G0012220.mRNA.1.CDS.1 [Saccharomyces cerevisiae]CAI6443578.1 CMF_HP2_G0012220.mRNA.1.CDS.1 [Saccharomyces cerevisiae]